MLAMREDAVREPAGGGGDGVERGQRQRRDAAHPPRQAAHVAGCVSRAVITRETLGPIQRSMSSMSVKAAGTITSVSAVDVSSPPMTATAIGARNELSPCNADRNRQHARDHRHGGHHDGPRALVARFEQRGEAVFAGAHLLDGEIHQQNRVLGDDAHQHQEADDDGQRERIAGDHQRERPHRRWRAAARTES